MSFAYAQKMVKWEARKPQNRYGDIEYELPVEIKARKQPHEDIIKTAEGKELMSKHVFYVDASETRQIEDMDKLDGELVVSKYVMCSLNNKARLVRFITV